MKKMRVIFMIAILSSFSVVVWAQGGVTITAPASSISASSSIQIDFNIGTAANSGTVKIVFTENTTTLDGPDPHTFTLKSIHESSGGHSFTLDASDFSNNTTNVASYLGGTALVDGAIYDVKIEYNDGTAYDATSTGITYDITAPTLISASRSSDTELVVALSEDCTGIANGNDGGFTVSETGTSAKTYAVSATAQGVDASHVVLTVASMATSGKEGVTVTYTAGGNGTVNDLAGNSLVTDATGVAVTAWDETSPTISSGTLATSNAYLDIVFSEGVYGANDGATALTIGRLALTFTQNEGGATNATILSVKKNDNADESSATALVGGETTVRVFLSITDTPSGVETVEVNPADGSSIYDAAGNAMLATQTTGVKTLHDHLAPSIISIVRKDAAAELTNAASVDFTVTFNEAVTGVVSGSFSLSGTGTGSASIGTPTTSDNIDWTVPVTTGDDGTLELELAIVAGISDLATNALASTYSDGEAYTVDKTAPTVSSIVRAGSTPTNSSSVDFTVTFDEAVTGVVSGSFSLSGTGTGSASIGTPTTSDNIDWTVPVTTGDDGTLELELAIVAGISDLATNALASTYSDGEAYTVDKTAPTVSSIVRAGSTPTNSSSVDFTVTFNEAVTGVVSGSFSLSGTGTGSASIGTPTTSDNIDWTVPVTTGDDGTLELELATVTGIADQATNALASTYSDGEAYTVDKTAPMVALSDNHPDAIVMNGNEVTITATFTEANEINESTPPTITIGSLVSNVAMTKSTNLEWTYVWAIPLGNDGIVSVSIAASDLAGNANSEATGITSYTIDNIQPTVVLADDHPDAIVHNTDVVNITATFTEANEIDESSPPTITIGSLVSSAPMSKSTNLEWIYEWTVPIGSDGSVNLSISATDVAGNINTAPSGKTSYTIDNTVPALTRVSIYSNNAEPAYAKVGDVVTLEFDANEAIQNPLVKMPGINTADITITDLGSNMWRATYKMTGSETEGTIPFLITVYDLAGNLQSKSEITVGSEVVYDKTDPTIDNISISSSNPRNHLAKKDDLVTLTFESSELLDINTVTVKFDGFDADNVSNVGNTWTATRTITGDEANGLLSISIEYSDMAGNVGAIRSGTTDATSVTVDRTAPTFDSLTIKSDNSNPTVAIEGDEITVDFTANETIENITVTIGGKAATVYNITGNRWAAINNVDNSFLEFITFNLTCYDLAGNKTSISHIESAKATTDESSVSYDSTPPLISNISIVSSNSPNTLAKVGDVVTITFTSSEELGDVDVLMYGINPASVSNTGNSWTATYTMRSDDDNGTIPFTITYSDLAGNSGPSKTQADASNSVKFDRNKPTLNSVAISSNNDNSIWAKKDDVITLTIEATEELKDPTVKILGNLATVSNPSSDKINWIAQYPVASGDAEGIAQFIIDFQDLSGNEASPVTAKTTGSNVTVDLTAPTLFNISMSPEKAKTGDMVTLTFSSSEVLLLPTVTFNSNSATSITETTTNNWEATYTVQGTDPSGALPFEISYTDRAMNSGVSISSTSVGSSTIVDNDLPTLTSVTISSSNTFDDARAKVGDEVTLSFTGSEALQNVVVSIAGQSASLSSSSDKITWTATYTMQETDVIGGQPQGEIPFTIDFDDLAGNTGVGVIETTAPSTSVWFDRVKPELTIVSLASNADYVKAGDEIKLDFVASEGIRNVTTQILGKLVTATSTDIDKKIWSASYTLLPTDIEGEMSIYLTYKDFTGNDGDAVSTTNDASSVVFDRTNPTVVLSDNHADAIAKNGDVITITATFTEANGIDEVTKPQLTIGANTYEMVKSTNLVWTYLWTVSEASDGPIALSVSATDVAGNANIEATGKTAYTVDNTLPDLTSVTISSNYVNSDRVKTGSVVTINFSASETIEGVSATILGNAAVVSNTAGNMWKATYTTNGTETTTGVDKMVDFSINFQDIAGNSVTASNSDITDGSSVTLDITPPDLNPITIYSDHTNPDRARVGSLIVLEFSASESIENVTATINTKNASVEFDSGSDTWFAYYYMKSTDAEGVLNFTIDYQDMAGNVGTQKEAITIGSNVTFDKVIPTFSVVSISSNNSTSSAFAADGNAVTLEFTTSENVETPIVTLNGIAATDITGGPTAWVASRILSSGENEGVIPFTIDAQDLAGNQAITAYSTSNASTVTFDDSEPGIVSISVDAGVYKVGDEIAVFIQADNNSYVGQTVEVNGKPQALINNNNNTYTVTYTVEEGDNDIFQLGSLPINVVFKDQAGNTRSRTEAISQGGTITVDANTPVINLVESDAEDVGNLIIDDQIVFTVTPETPEEGLVVQPAVYNSKPLVWSTTDGGVTYSATYTVTEDDDKQETPLQLTPVTLTDAAGNASASEVYGGVQKSIYATRPTATISGTTTKCDFGQMVPIRFDFTGYAPYQLTYNDGTTDVGPIEVVDDFYEFEAERGTFTLVNLTDAKGNYSTSALQDAVVTVNPLPNITLNILGSPFNINDPRVNLTDFATPAGGIFSGDGVSANGYFYPSMIELDGDSKTVQLTYTYPDNNGCQNSVTQDVIVSSGGAVIEGVQSTYCQYNASFDVVGKNPNSIVGWFDMPTSTKGWTDNGDNTLTISPQELNAGEHTIEYFYVDGGTTFDTERTFVIDSVGANIDFVPLQATYCADDDVVALQAQNLYPSGGTGYFVGPANGFGTQPGSNQATFEPSLVGEFDKSYEISYYYQSPQGCVSNTIVKQVQVNSLPILSFDVRDNYNYNESPVALQGNFTEGVFTATGGIVVDNILYPDRKEPGAINITYFYQDPVTGCSNSLTKPSRIREAAEVIEGLSSIYCYSTDIITISSEVTDDATIIGEFSSEKGGIISVDGNTALYSIAKAGSGNDKVTFSYSIGDTPYEVSTSVLIDSIGPVTITGLGEHFCADDQPVEIRGYLENAPQGTRSLSYSGTPLAFNSTGSVATLSPALEEQGVFEVNFTFTSVVSGCSRDTTYSFEIHSLPSVGTDIPDYYNIDAEPLELVGSPSGGVFSAERGVSGSELYPEVAGAGAHSITYTYTDVFGCVNSALHNIVIIGADGEITMPNFTCIDSEPFTISASTSNGLVGEFIGKGVANTGEDEAVFDPSVAGKGIHTITYKYLFVDDAETELFLTRDIEVDSLGNVEIYGLEEMYCYNDPSALLTASPAGGNFTSTEYLVVNRFYPSMSSTESLNPVTYTYTSSRTGCSITGTTDVSVRPVPQVSFSVEQSCSDLETDPVQFINNTKSDDPVDSWKWSFDSQGFATSNEESPNYLYLTSGSKLVTLIATTTFGCESQMDSIVNVGLVPKANFSWENECQNNREAILTSSSESANIVNYKWELPDGTTYEGETLNTIGHIFPEVDTYNVKLVITSQENCKDSIVKPIRILPVVKFDEISGEFYFENFETNDGNWLARGITESDVYSWSLGQPEGEIINNAASGQNAWYTHIDMANQAVEKSQVVSPCFDFSGLERPMVRMGIWSSPVAGRNGAVVQYTTDDGKTWETLGEEESGINWYNSSSIQSQPGGQITGWSSHEMESWEVARHSLDELKGETNVRFRIAFAADGLAIDYFDGFAFDDFWIGNREQNLLVEYFTNAVLSTTTQANSQMAQLEEANSLDIVPIHYHTDSPSGDPLFNLYPSGISARQFSYGVTGIPYALANGTEEFNFSSFGVNQASIVNIERLKDPSMGISVSGTAGNSLDLNVKIKALEPIENQELVVHCAIVQKQYVLDEAINNQIEFFNVIRQFIPDPGGSQIKSVWNEGDEEHLALSWQIPGNLDKELLSVVVFVQNVQTHKVYQVEMVNLSDITTSNRPDTEQSVALYPNPATSKVRIESPQDIEQISIIDASGRVLKVIAVHNTQIDIDVNELKVGLYIVNIKLKEGFKALRFVKK